MQIMAIISTFKSIISARKNQNISIKKGENINILPTEQQSSANDETLITVQVNQQLQKRVQRIKEMIADKAMKCYRAEDLVMIDAIQRLGLQYYFKNEIADALTRHYEICGSGEGDCNLHDTALRFRLLRQHGYNVSADCFSKFKDEDGNFKQELRKDSKGLMSLYEAYQFRVPGDDILDDIDCFSKFKDKDGNFKQELRKDIKGLMSLYEAYHVHVPGDDILDDIGEFSGHLLRKMTNNESSKGSIIENTLSHPFHKIIPRFMALDFLQNLEISMKSLHNLSDESNWMKEMQYLAAIDINMAQINHQRETIQVSRWWKGLRLTEELKLARNQPAKWHMWSLTCLPSPDMAEQRVELTKAIAFVYIVDDIFDVYGTLDELILFTEAVNRWEHDNVTGLPNYMSVCLKNLYEQINEISEKAYDIHGWNPKVFLQTVDENQDGHDGSYIACYVNEHKGSSTESVREHVHTMISDAWKCLNEMCQSSSPFSAYFKEAVLNSARMVPLMYNYDESSRLPSLEKHMKSLLISEQTTVIS